MSRSSAKYLVATFNDLHLFYKKIVWNKKFYLKKQRITSLNLLNYDNRYSIHQGQFFSSFFTTKFHCGLKLGFLSKTRRPFFFWDKRKKRIDLLLSLLLLF